VARPLPRWRKAIYGLVPALALVVILEIVARVHAGGRIERLTGVVEWDEFGWQGTTYFWDAYHPRLGWTNLPGYASDERVPFRVHINEQGLRAKREYALEPPPDAERVVFVGDSTAFGEEVDDDATVPALLESVLAGVEVLNFGVRGYGLGQMVLRLEEDGFAFGPDHVIALVLLPEDLRRDAVPFFTHPKPVFTLAGGELVVENVPVMVGARQPWLLRHSFAAAWLRGRPEAGPEAGERGQVLGTATALVERLGRGCAAHGATATIVTISTAGALDRLVGDEALRREVDRMRRALRSADVDVLDLIAPLAGAYRARGASLVAPRGHWSREGNLLIARGIAFYLSERSARAQPDGGLRLRDEARHPAGGGGTARPSASRDGAAGP
jgi:hypothetical protein